MFKNWKMNNDYNNMFYLEQDRLFHELLKYLIFFGYQSAAVVNRLFDAMKIKYDKIYAIFVINKIKNYIYMYINIIVFLY